jgi:hypothetical protein
MTIPSVRDRPTTVITHHQQPQFIHPPPPLRGSQESEVRTQEPEVLTMLSSMLC